MEPCGIATLNVCPDEFLSMTLRFLSDKRDLNTHTDKCFRHIAEYSQW